MNLSKPIQRSLPVPLTTTEKIEYGRSLAHLHQEYALIELEKKSVSDTFKGKLEELDGRIGSLARIVRDQEEYRHVDCQWRYEFETNQKELIRMDTGEVIETKPIEDSERQLLLQIEQAKEASEAAQSQS